MTAEAKKRIVKYFLDNNILVSTELIEQLQGFTPEELKEKINMIDSGEMLLLNDDATKILEKGVKDVNWRGLENAQALAEKGRPGQDKTIESVRSLEPDKPQTAFPLRIVKSYNEPTRKYEPADFVAYFNARFKELERILRNRQELSLVSSIARILSKTDRENVALIGIVKEKTTTHSGKIILMMEDLSGEIRVMVDPGRQDVFAMAKSIVHDEVIGITGTSGNKMVFASAIIVPDVPLLKEVKKAKEAGYAAFLSDLHVGSKKFLKEEFEKFIRWINDAEGRHAHIIQNLKYLFIVGDLVDGVGIYPGQEQELAITDIYEQYRECARLLSQIPSRICIIICSGNHDALRMSEPQPQLYKEFCQPIYDLPNVTVVSNPATVNIHSGPDFSGFDVLIYHGYSFDYYIQNVDEIRNSGGYDRADMVMKFLLQRRHLSPTHTATLYVPDAKKDPLVIDTIPDFFVTGHIHKTAVSSYRNISLICGSCWQAKTDFQERVGHHPEPARVPIVNLQTRETKILRF